MPLINAFANAMGDRYDNSMLVGTDDVVVADRVGAGLLDLVLSLVDLHRLLELLKARSVSVGIHQLCRTLAVFHCLSLSLLSHCDATLDHGLSVGVQAVADGHDCYCGRDPSHGESAGGLKEVARGNASVGGKGSGGLSEHGM